VTLPAYAADRRRACSTAPAVRPQLSIDISSPQEAQQQTRRPLLLLSINGTDRWTDRLTDAPPLHRPCSACCAGSVNKRLLQVEEQAEEGEDKEKDELTDEG